MAVRMMAQCHRVVVLQHPPRATTLRRYSGRGVEGWRRGHGSRVVVPRTSTTNWLATRTHSATSTTSAAGTTRSHYTYPSPGSFGEEDSQHHHDHHDHHYTSTTRRNYRHRGYTVGIGGPVGSGKTALVLQLCRHLPTDCRLGVVTNDIFTQEDAEFLTRHEALEAWRIRAVETGGCPHAAIREDVSSNLTALEELTRTAAVNNHNTLQPCLLLCESGGDNLAANFSRELADLTLYVIDVAGGDKVPRKGGPGITQSDLLIINKMDLADAVGADLQVMQRDAHRMRTSSMSIKSGTTTTGPTLLAAVKHGQGVPEICEFILQHYRKAMAAIVKEEEEEKEEK